MSTAAEELHLRCVEASQEAIVERSLADKKLARCEKAAADDMRELRRNLKELQRTEALQQQWGYEEVVSLQLAQAKLVQEETAAAASEVARSEAADVLKRVELSMSTTMQELQTEVALLREAGQAEELETARSQAAAVKRGDLLQRRNLELEAEALEDQRRAKDQQIQCSTALQQNLDLREELAVQHRLVSELRDQEQAQQRQLREEALHLQYESEQLALLQVTNASIARKGQHFRRLEDEASTAQASSPPRLSRDLLRTPLSSRRLSQFSPLPPRHHELRPGVEHRRFRTIAPPRGGGTTDSDGDAKSSGSSGSFDDLRLRAEVWRAPMSAREQVLRGRVAELKRSLAATTTSAASAAAAGQTTTSGGGRRARAAGSRQGQRQPISRAGAALSSSSDSSLERFRTEEKALRLRSLRG